MATKKVEPINLIQNFKGLLIAGGATVIGMGIWFYDKEVSILQKELSAQQQVITLIEKKHEIEKLIQQNETLRLKTRYENMAFKTSLKYLQEINALKSTLSSPPPIDGKTAINLLIQKAEKDLAAQKIVADNQKEEYEEAKRKALVNLKALRKKGLGLGLDPEIILNKYKESLLKSKATEDLSNHINLSSFAEMVAPISGQLNDAAMQQVKVTPSHFDQNNDNHSTYRGKMIASK